MGSIIGFILIPGFTFLSMHAIGDIRKGEGDVMSYFGLALTAFTLCLIIRFVIPFYKNSFKNVKRQDKLVVDTVVLAIKKRTTSKGIKYLIETEFRYLDPWAISTIMRPSLPYHEMRVHMPITIHCFEDNKIDILYIEKTDFKNRCDIL